MAKKYDPIRDCSPSLPAFLPARPVSRSSLAYLLSPEDPPAPPLPPTSASDDEEGLQSPDLGQDDTPLPAAPPPAVNPYDSPPKASSSLPARPSSSSITAASFEPVASSSKLYAPNRITNPTIIIRPISLDQYHCARQNPSAGSRNALRGWSRDGSTSTASSTTGSHGVKRGADEREESEGEGGKRMRVDGGGGDMNGGFGRNGGETRGEDVKAIASHCQCPPSLPLSLRSFAFQYLSVSFLITN